jgi:hypothetical protein
MPTRPKGLDPDRLTPAIVQQALRLLAGLEVDDAEAAALVPLIEATQKQLALLDRFDVRETRSALTFDPTHRSPDEHQSSVI